MGVLSGAPVDGTSGTHVLVVKVTDASGAIRKRALPLLIEDATNPSYADWAEFMFDDSGLSAGALAEDQDPEGDRIPNLMEYALGLDPQRADSQGSVDWDLSVNRVRVGFVRGKAHLRYYLEATDNLQDWANADVLWDSQVDVGELASVGEAQLVDEAFVGGEQLFIRLAVAAAAE